MRELLRAAALQPVPASMELVVGPAERSPSDEERVRPSRRELRRLLHAAATHPVPAVGDLGAVRGATPLHADAAPLILVRDRRRDRPARRPAVLTGAAAAAATTLVLVGALTGVVNGSGDDAALVLGVAVDTSVVLPDGTTIDGARGLSLPDGAVVRTGPAGRAIAGNVELGPGLEAIVDAGALLPTGVPLAAPADPVTPDPVTPRPGPGAAVAAVADDGAAPTVPDTTPVVPVDAHTGAVGGAPPLSVTASGPDPGSGAHQGH
jgi:hypothetical protein